MATCTASPASTADAGPIVARAYLDHASSSPLRPVAFDAMVPFLRDHHADPGRVHSDGRVTRVAIEQAREQVAAFVGARPREVVFTSGGTEAVNAAVWGGCTRARDDGRVAHVVTTQVEHSAVLDAAHRHADAVVAVGVDRVGRFDPADVIAAITDATTLVSVQLANHEVGTRQPIHDVVAACRDRGVLVHVDACASIGHEPVDFAALGADLCSITAHKWGGPKGAGALLVRRGLRVPPLILGGAQERARRGGIENVPAIVGFGAAAQHAAALLEAETREQRTHRDALAAVVRNVDGVEWFGDTDDALPNILCFGVAGVEAEPIVLALDQHGVSVHSGSSCSSEMLEPSPVLEAMGVDAEHSLRVSVGWTTTRDDIGAFLIAFPAVVEKLRQLRS
jgi:cysteine desulfurase